METTGGETIGLGPRIDDGRLYRNPGQCAEDALLAVDERRGYERANDGWGTSDDTSTSGTVGTLHGRCGEPGRGPNPGPDPGEMGRGTWTGPENRTGSGRDTASRTGGAATDTRQRTSL
ncbi:hypothetical protein BRC93_00675 [Halobacteriales archaeon QS_5_70_15]|nr:MAG: hypothetical protein BRC93_00675 [Halobacteriales archaeon QS_5_70_15]